MATNNYEIDYNDDRFTKVEEDKQMAVNDLNNTYGSMINQSDQFYQNQIQANDDYAKQQQDIQQQNTNFVIEKIEQQKQQAEKDYTKEQKGAYTDWQKQSNQYGVNAEQMATQGLSNTGYSESSQVSMYNQYQNRVTTARESYNKAVLEYDNAIKDAQLQNNAKLAEIAYQSLQAKLQISLEGFQYKNTLLLDQVAKKQELDNTYYGRRQDVLAQINQENSLAEQVRQYNENKAFQEKQYNESIRQYNEKMAYQKERDRVADSQWQKTYDLQKKASSGSSGGSRSSGGSSGGSASIKKTSGNTSVNKTQTAKKSLPAISSKAHKLINEYKNKVKMGIPSTQQAYKMMAMAQVNSDFKNGKLTEGEVRYIVNTLGL